MRPNLVTPPYLDNLVGLSLYEAPLFVAGALGAVWFHLTRRRVYMLVMISGLVLWYYQLKRVGIWSDAFWSPFAEGIGQGGVIYGLAALDRWFAKRVPGGHGGPQSPRSAAGQQPE